MNNKRKLEYDIVYMKVAKTISELSYSKRNKVGCIIVSEDGQIVSQGYNGTPTGFDNCCENIECTCKYHKGCVYTGKPIKDQLDFNFCTTALKSLDYEKSYPCSYLVMTTKPEVLHAESNAISKCSKYFSSTLNTTMYITLSPCIDCAKMIIQSGIKRIVFDELYRNIDGLELLKKSNIIVEQLINKENKYELIRY